MCHVNKLALALLNPVTIAAPVAVAGRLVPCTGCLASSTVLFKELLGYRGYRLLR